MEENKKSSKHCEKIEPVSENELPDMDENEPKGLGGMELKDIGTNDMGEVKGDKWSKNPLYYDDMPDGMDAERMPWNNDYSGMNDSVYPMYDSGYGSSYGYERKETYADMFHDVLRDFEEVENLTDDVKNSRWWKIPLSDDMAVRDDRYYTFYCAINHLKMTYPYLNYVKYFKKSGHSYFGIRYDNDGEIKFLVYGIEGRNIPQEQPYMGMTGFVKWAKFKNMDNGMWVMYYNPFNGAIMVPKDKK
jgi:hypothetical protein